MLKDQEQLLRTLISRGALTAPAVEELRGRARESKLTPEELILKEGTVTDEQMTVVKSELLNIPTVNLKGKPIPRKTLIMIPLEVAENYKMVAFELTPERELKVGMVNPQNFKAMEAVEFLAQKSNLKVSYFLISDTSFRDVYRQYRGLGEEAQEALSHLDDTPFESLDKIQAPEDMEKVIKSAPVSKMVLVIMRHAIDGRASDIHIEPSLKETRIRYRIDGLLRTSLVLPHYIQAAIIARIKVLANLKLDETRKPQDGRIRMTVDNRDIDFRVSTLPMIEGEKVVLRILDTSGNIPSLEHLGFDGKHVEAIKRTIAQPHGLILVTGPTGSGKTTTLYTLLTMLNNEESNIITLEDPIEYYIDGINQSQVNPEVHYTFANGLRAILRQDPNIIMLGEIRDTETTELVIHASLTGHLVLSTLHTNNAIGAFARLLDLKAEPFLLSSVINMVVAQRLARKVCQDCKEVDAAIPNELLKRVQTELSGIPAGRLVDIDQNKLTFFRGKGCAHCGGQGYRGRIAIAELIVITPKFRELIARKASIADSDQELASQEFITLTQDGIMKALQGLTTLEEVMRVSQL